MKKLTLIFLVLSAIAMAADKGNQRQNTQQAKSSQGTTMTSATNVTKSDSFMSAFGMGSNNTTASGGSSVSSGTTSAALNVSNTISNNSVSVATPYTKTK